MIFEELGFRVESIRHTLLRDDILLASVDDANEAKFERIYASGQNIECIRPSIHDVELRQNTYRPTTLGVNTPCKFQ